jgi:DNA replication and repair protein RecF
MIITKLHLSNFRNFKKFQIHFSSSITIIIGPNASGKTNIIESLFMVSTGKSFRDVVERETIAFDNEMAKIEGEIIQPARNITQSVADGISNKNEKEKLEIILTTGQVMGIATPNKKHTINGVSKRMIDFVGQLKTVLFWPQDMELITGSPTLRRKYLNFVLMQVDREYRRTLISYEKGIRQRNKILENIRDNNAHRHQLLFWDQLIIKAGEYITKKREEYIEFINNYPLPIINYQFTNYQLFYDKSIISRQRLDQYANEEIAAAVTLVGPHRDDFIFEIKDKKSKIKDDEDYRNLSHFGSRGEQRLAILWLKLCELAYVEKETNDKPVLLLDDIFSELDHKHRDIIFDMVGNQQTIMTTTDKHFIPELGKEVRIIELGDIK